MFSDPTARRSRDAEDRPSAIVLYQFFSPEEVVGAALFSDLTAGLVERGWEVSAYPSIFGFGDPSPKHPRRERWNGVDIRRVWRPRLRQWSNIGRALNALWMTMRWSILALSKKVNPDVVIIGTDPVMSITVARMWRRFKPETKVVHWCFDLYPEAAVADGTLANRGILMRAMQPVLRKAYRCCDLIADLGICMRERLRLYGSGARIITLVPWALEEHTAPVQADLSARTSLFGSVPLALMYSGSFGRAHECDLFLKLADLLAPDEARIVFSASGSRLKELQAATGSHPSVRLVDPAPLNRLTERLACADVHLVSLRPEWTGTVVPSKFFGALAVGRPVLFAGSPDCAIARWIKELNVGWVLTEENLHEVMASLREYSFDIAAQGRMNHRCFEIYNRRFSRQVSIKQWDIELRALLETAPVSAQVTIV